MLTHHLLHELIVVPKQPEPTLVAHRCGAAGGIDDIGEQYGSEHTFQLNHSVITMACDELLYIPEHGLDIAQPERVVVTRRVFDILAPRNCSGELTSERRPAPEDQLCDGAPTWVPAVSAELR